MTIKECPNCPGRDDHDAEHCPIKPAWQIDSEGVLRNANGEWVAELVAWDKEKLVVMLGDEAKPKASAFPGEWRIEYENDTGPRDEGFRQWWEVTNGEQRFTCDTEEQAEALLALINSAQPQASAHVEWPVSLMESALTGKPATGRCITCNCTTRCGKLFCEDHSYLMPGDQAIAAQSAPAGEREVAEVFAIPVREGGKRTTFYTEVLPFVPGPGVEVLGEPVRMVAAQSAPAGELWAVHAQGPDDLYAAFSREDAERHASELNAIPAPEGVRVSAVVIQSPWSPAEHWQYLAEQEREHCDELMASWQRTQSAGVPEGWRLVPLEPTEEMIDAGCREHTCVQGDSWYSDSEISEHDAIAVFKAMLAAASKVAPHG